MVKNREIKLRAWDKENKRMFIVGELEFLMGGEERVSWVNACHATDGILVKQVKLMQYIGLKDKNGVEIYEGDIIKMGVNHPAVSHYYFLVEWDNDATGFKPFLYYEDSDEYDHWVKAKDVEVAGNIYEDHELIKKQGWSFGGGRYEKR